jgi:hypothetical protein
LGTYISEADEKYIITEFLEKGSLLNVLQEERATITFEDQLEMYKILYKIPNFLGLTTLPRV